MRTSCEEMAPHLRYALIKIKYTEYDDAPMLAIFSLLPVIQRFANPWALRSRGISVAEHMIAYFPESS